MTLGRLGLLFVAVLVGTSSAAAERDGFALVLGGGGAKGFAHIGVIEALEELGVAPSLVVGTSMGAILGSLYASGLDAATIESQVDDRNWLRTLLDRDAPVQVVQGGWSALPPAQVRLRLDSWPPTLPAGASQGHAVEALVGRLTAEASYEAQGDFDRLPIPFRAVATDLMAGEAVVFDRGPLPHLVRASGSLPFVFVPVVYEGRFFLDGGFVDNLPLSVARDLGYDRALVVDVSNAFLPLDAVPSDFVSLLQRTTQLAQRAENRIEPTDADVVLRVDLRRHNLFSFYSARDIIRCGYDAVMARRAEILALATTGRSTEAPARPAGESEVLRRVDEVEVVGARRLSPASIRKRLGVAPGDSLALADLYQRAEELSRQPIFENVWIEIVPSADGGAHVRAHVDESDRPELELAGNYRDGIGAAALARLRLDNRFGAGGSRTLSWRISPEFASLRLDTAVPIRGSRDVELRVGGGWLREELDVVRPRDDAWDFRRGVGDARVVFARGLGKPAVHIGIEAAEGRRFLVSRSPEGSGRLAWRAVRVGIETWTGGGLGVWPSEGLALTYRHAFSIAGGRSDAWSLEGGWIDRPVVRRRWGINVAAGGAWSATDMPVDLQPRAGGPRGWVGQDPWSLVAPRLLWGRTGLDVYLNREVRVELAAALGWSGERSLAEQPPRPGAQLQVAWESALGPIRLGWAGGRGEQPRLVLDVGREF